MSHVKVVDQNDLRNSPNEVAVVLSEADFKRLVRRLCGDRVNQETFRANVADHLHDMASRYANVPSYSDAQLALDMSDVMWDITFLNSEKVLALTANKSEE